jgi:hypothetical protein
MSLKKRIDMICKDGSKAAKMAVAIEKFLLEVK